VRFFHDVKMTFLVQNSRNDFIVNIGETKVKLSNAIVAKLLKRLGLISENSASAGLFSPLLRPIVSV